MKQFDVAVIGGGILGLAHAWMALERGLKTVLLERDARCQAASVRNFGMIWPIGQPAGELYEIALRSRRYWLKLRDWGDIYVRPCGSLHLARHEDELAVLEEYVAGDGNGRNVQLLAPDQVAARSPGAKMDGLLAALWSETELCVNPVQAIDQIRRLLVEQSGLTALLGHNVVAIDQESLTTSAGVRLVAERIVVCSGSDFKTLFPQQYSAAGLKRCKLQMMATDAQPGDWQLGPHLAGGLTLRHYRSFENCPSLTRLRQRVNQQQPLLDRYGIHVMAAQNDSGQVLLGDSHQYDDEITPFDSAEIENLMLAELEKLIELPDFKISRRWHGIYAKHREQPIVVLEPQPNCKIVTAPGGAGMTLGFGIAEQTFQNW